LLVLVLVLVVLPFGILKRHTGKMREYGLLLAPLLVTVVIMTAYKSSTQSNNIRSELNLMQQQVLATSGSVMNTASASTTASTLSSVTAATTASTLTAATTASTLTAATSQTQQVASTTSAASTVSQIAQTTQQVVTPTTQTSSTLQTTSQTMDSMVAVTTEGDDASCPDCPDSVTSKPCSVSGNAVLGGVDMVQYFTTFKKSDGTYDTTQVGEVGSSEFASTYDGFQYYFLSEDNKALFDASPTSYIPQWGGFCSWGIGGESCPQYAWSATCLGPSGDWSLWTIYDEKLYFFFAVGAVTKFTADPDTYVAAGNARWSSWFDDSYAHMSTECYVNPNE
jgi:YHS domain-containing protein